MKTKQGVLFQNTLMLYILTFSNYLFNFISVPYQTRLFGPEVYGELGFAQALMAYVQMVLDFGFILSSTEDVALNKDNKAKLSKITSSVLYCKLFLGAISLIVISILCSSIERLKANMILYMLFFLSTLVNCLLPDFLYRGLEKMTAITVRTVAVKAFFTLAIFVLLRNKEQAYLVPVLNTLGGLGACAWSYYDIKKNYGVQIIKVSLKTVFETFKRSAGFFVSRIASTVYGATNTLIIGFIHPVGNLLGYYSSAERLTTTAKSVFSPIADSLYPYMVSNKDYKTVKKILLLLMPIILAGCTIVGFFADDFCAFIFGAEYAGCGKYLRYLMPTVLITLPEYIFGFPALSPLGLGRFANYSVIMGAILHGVLLLSFYIFGILSVEAICISTCITEFSVLIFRIVVFCFGQKAKLKIRK